MPRRILTTSWDDGAPQDLRLAEMLARHGIAGTFFIPFANVEGRDVLTAGQKRDLRTAGFEIGAHGLDHRRLTRWMPAKERWRQISDGKDRLEQEIGQPVPGFCYPGGRGIAATAAFVERAGYAYARTTKMLCWDLEENPFRRPTTLQVYPHTPIALLRNWLSKGRGHRRLALLKRLASAGNDLETRLSLLLDIWSQDGGLLHLWGHSWEIDALELWPVLERFFQRAAAVTSPQDRRTNAALASAGTPS